MGNPTHVYDLKGETFVSPFFMVYCLSFPLLMEGLGEVLNHLQYCLLRFQ